MKHLLITLTAVCFLLIGGFNNFAQTTQNSSKKKLVKCSEKGKIVYRTKCKTKKSQTVAKKSAPDEKYGDPSSKFEIVEGVGSGRGTGVGTGSGQGVGSGTGRGTGTGAGSGSGNGNSSVVTTSPPTSVNTTEGRVGIKIISKPKAEYTEIARTNQVQGTVTLKVTFLADGTIGAVAPVRGLPDGLTQQAVDAAKRIKFTPESKNGKPITVTKQVQYSFFLY